MSRHPAGRTFDIDAPLTRSERVLRVALIVYPLALAAAGVWAVVSFAMWVTS